MSKKLTTNELKRISSERKKKGILKPKPVYIPKNNKYDKIYILKQRIKELFD